MNKYFRIFLGFTLCIFFCYGCEKENITPKTSAPTGTISFKNDIVPILQANCVSCHNSSGPSPNIANNPYENLQPYINKSSPTSSQVYVEISSGMGNLSSTQEQEILKWIEQGALNN